MLERRRLPGGLVALVSADFESDGYLVAFTERSGGSSSGPYATLNLGLRVDDDSAVVIQNRRRVCSAFRLPPFVTGEQVHGSRHAWIGPDLGQPSFTDPNEAVPGVDSLLTETPGVPLAVLSADCVPVALIDRRAGRLGVMHAGWRGVAGGIMAATVAAFDHARDVRAIVGPAICIDHYQVGEDVARAVAEGAGGRVPSKRKDGRLFIDVRGAVAVALGAAGVQDVEQADECTACEPDRFFSYRRDGVTGRQALVAARR
jgi:YfiH family protein